MIYIYALAEPETGEIRYVGKSSNPQNRIYSHESKSAARGVRAWVLELKERGLRPKLVILREVGCDEDPDAAELAAIAEHGEASAGERLLNCIGTPHSWFVRMMEAS